ncbi:MAG: hypothetical protein K2L60_11330 [Bacteroides sp.]|nr:hypothetical protein [Bacteroides sp.]
MRKRLFFLTVLLFMATVEVFSQRSLEIKDVSSGMNVFSGKDTEAGIVISCPGNIELSFESSHDKVVDVYNKEMKGEEMFYYLRFNTGKKYRGRKLTIRSKDYAALTIMADLEPKDLKQYQLLDPDVEFVYGCYYEYRKRGTDFFQKSMYNEAKEQYSIAKECSDCPADANLDELMANIDSISLFQKQAEAAAALLDYRAASDLYDKILVLNPSDINASNKSAEYEQLYGTDCKRYFDMAEVYKVDGEYQKALELYQKVVDANCTNALLASEQAKRIRILLQNRKQRSHVFTFEYGSGHSPFGFSYGSYKNRKVGHYFTLSLHPDVFYTMRKDYDKCEKAEVSITPLGWTFNPVPKHPYGWIFLGLGYTGVLRYETADGEIYQPGTYVPSDNPEEMGERMEEPQLKVYSAISPEIGVVAKVWRFAVRYTFQYRFSLGKKYEDRISKTRHSIGVGVCF